MNCTLFSISFYVQISVSDPHIFRIFLLVVLIPSKTKLKKILNVAFLPSTYVFECDLQQLFHLPGKVIISKRISCAALT